MPGNLHRVLIPELRDKNLQVYNDPSRLGSPEWYMAANTLFEAGLIQVEPDDGDVTPEVEGVAPP